MKWYVYVTTPNGRALLWYHGYRTKKEATRVAEMAAKLPETKKVEVVKEI